MSESFFSNQEDSEIVAKDEAIGASGLQTLIASTTKLSTTVCEATLEPEDKWGNDAKLKVIHHVTENGAFKDHQVPHNLKIFDKDSKKRDKARADLLVYDKLGSGNILKKLKEVGAKKVLENHAFIIRELCGTSVVAEINLWEMDAEATDKDTGEKTTVNKDGSKLVRRGNNVKSVFNKDTMTTAIEDQRIIEFAQYDPDYSGSGASPQEDAFKDDGEDDIPF